VIADEPKLKAIAPWYGSKRTLAPEIVRQLGPHNYYFEGCAASMAVLFAKEPAHHEVVCDVHGALTNLAWILQDALAAETLYERLYHTLYSDEIYRASKQWLDEHEGKTVNEMHSGPGLQSISRNGVQASLNWAFHYFLASWMGRNGVAGTARVNYQIATRWTAGGGSGPLRFANAVDSIPAWHQRLRNVHILRRNLFDVLPSLDDADDTAIYVDPPYFPETRGALSDGRQGSKTAKYLHDFIEADHVRLAESLCKFRRARVVVSYYGSPKLAGLYPGWTQIDC